MCLWNDSRFSVLWQFLNHLFPLWKYLCSLFIYIVPAGSYLCDIPAWMTAQSVPDQAYLCYVVDVWRHSQLMSCSWRMTVCTVSAWSSLSVSCSWRMTAYLCPMPDKWRHITCLMIYIFSWWMMTQILQVVMYVPIRCKIICQCSNVLLCRYFLYALY